MNYENDLEIDEQGLDVEWLEQPQLMMKYVRIQSKSQREEEKAKEKLEFVDAELDIKIRKNPEKYKIEKITEAAVKSTILMDTQHIEAYEEYLDAKFENNVAKGAVKAFDQRKDALENLVKLHGQSYFAGPKMPRDITKEKTKRDEDKERTNKMNAEMAKRIRRRNQE